MTQLSPVPFAGGNIEEDEDQEEEEMIICPSLFYSHDGEAH